MGEQLRKNNSQDSTSVQCCFDFIDEGVGVLWGPAHMHSLVVSFGIVPLEAATYSA